MPATARLTSPAQMVASLPLWLGYGPTESLVVVCLHEPRGRVGLTLRFDLPAGDRERTLAEDVARRVSHEGASRVLLVVYTDEANAAGLAREALVQALMEEICDIDVTDALLVSDGNFWSYLCENVRCCPPQGTALSTAADDAAVRLLEAEAVLRGQAFMIDREALAASLAGPTTGSEQEAEAEARCEEAFAPLLDAVRSRTQTAFREAMRMRWSAALAAEATPPAVLDPQEAAVLAVSLADKALRDDLTASQDATTLRRLTAALCRLTPDAYCAPVSTLYAWLSYCDGGGAEVTIAVERALASDPDYRLALLLQELMLGQVPPSVVRQLTREAVAPTSRRTAQR